MRRRGRKRREGGREGAPREPDLPNRPRDRSSRHVTSSPRAGTCTAETTLTVCSYESSANDSPRFITFCYRERYPNCGSSSHAPHTPTRRASTRLASTRTKRNETPRAMVSGLMGLKKMPDHGSYIDLTKLEVQEKHILENLSSHDLREHAKIAASAVVNKNKTHIICTLGPVSRDVQIIEKMLQGGDEHRAVQLLARRRTSTTRRRWITCASRARTRARAAGFSSTRKGRRFAPGCSTTASR